MARVLAALVVTLLSSATMGVVGLGLGWFGEHEAPGEPTPVRVPDRVLSARADRLFRAADGLGAPVDRQILFGDFHVHSTFSTDAFMASLPLLSGEGAHPPADACDFARFCSGLDFWSINDHAEGLTPRHWQETIDSIRQCNDVGGAGADPDVVAFLGWEWTQVGESPDDHYGHKNVVLAHTDDARIPRRPIGAAGLARRALGAWPIWARIGLFAAMPEPRHLDLTTYMEELGAVPTCPEGVPVRDLPHDCMEHAATPARLFEKLDDWGHDAIVIPHGTTWGSYTPAGSTWDEQLAGQHDPKRQTLIEVFSGHGGAEEYRSFRAVRRHRRRPPTCPEPSAAYLPSCWRAGEIIRERCTADGESATVCDAWAAEARERYVAGSQSGHLTIPGVRVEDWLDAGQCRDCFLPAFNYRPGGSAQYIMAIQNFDDPAHPKRFRFGFMASSDVHTARPGTGYKDFERRRMTDSSGPSSAEARSLLGLPDEPPAPRSRPFDTSTLSSPLLQLEVERQASFFTTGGLIAVHAERRDRSSIWGAVQRREVYGTSGDRILLWFDLQNPPRTDGATVPMGSAVEMATAPRFRVRAVGAFEQRPGCPEHARRALGSDRLELLCGGECYHPGERRKHIDRIDVVRIRPQLTPREDVGRLIDDPWRSFPCPPDPAGCQVEFEDPDFPSAGRDTLYYARAIQEPGATINGANLRCDYDDSGRCVSVDPCFADDRTPAEDDCTAPEAERAWSSPIFVDYGRPPAVP